MHIDESFISHLNLIYENSRDFVFFLYKIGNDYEYIYTNKSAREMLGQDVIGKTLLECAEPDTAKFILNNYNKAVSKDEQLEFEDYAYFKFSVHKHETTVTPVIIGSSKFVLAVTKEIAFDQDLQDKYLFMRSVFFKTFLSTILIKNDGTLIEANPTFTESFNLHLEDVRGKKFYDLPIFTETSVLQIQQYIKEANNGDHFASKMITFVDHNGKEQYYMATFSPVHREEEVVAIFLIFQDVTNYILQQNQLKTTKHGLQTLKQALNQAAEMTITNLDGEIIEVNDRFLERAGYKREELLGQTHNILNSNYHPAEFFKDLWDTVTAGNVWRGEVRNVTKSGEPYWVDTTIIPLTNEQNEVYQFLTFNFNVSDKKQLMIELRNIERTFRLITENTNDFIAVFKQNGKLLYSSPSYIRQLGYSEDEFNQLSYEEIVHKDSLSLWHELINNNDNVQKDGNIELKLVAKNGDIVWTEGKYSIVYDHLGDMASQIIMVSREITERKEREDSLMFLAYHDSLTQLPNRRFLQNEFPHYVERANDSFESFAVLYIDGDNFKAVNDKYGHDVGDEFIANFGKTLLKSVRKHDLVIRIGGDEFVIIIGNLNRDPVALKSAMERIIDTINMNLAQGWTIHDVEFKPTATIGVSIYPNDGKTLDELIDFADKALYKAKQHSKNGVSIPYLDEMQTN